MGEAQERDEAAARTDHSSDCCCPWFPGKSAKVGIQGQRQALTLLQNDSVRSAASSTNLRVGAELGEVRHIRCRTFPRAIEKRVPLLFYHRPRARGGCRICAANSRQSSRARTGSRSEALSQPFAPT
ncbi:MULTISPECIES: hypothetical protein [Paenibacillus]|uniref:hypothetical protein n=1 Tax=Paenibacillus TaxID=44249 RepID=UPI0012FE4E60|nr:MULTISPECIES: hypothetical protein [Paenibacillus]KAF6583175.1 hypothetical protein G9G57_15045 [Paenibacillus sp. EKM211P]